MSYGGRYADHHDEPSRRQAPREEASLTSINGAKLTQSDRINHDTMISHQPPLRDHLPMNPLDKQLEKFLFPSEVVLVLVPVLLDLELHFLSRNKVLQPEDSPFLLLLPRSRRCR